MPDSVGLGCPQFSIAAYIENRPGMMSYASLNYITPLVQGEIHEIGQACGNGWRKVFNVFAKLLYELDSDIFPYSKCAPSWQNYRDHFLLQAGSNTSLIFTPPVLGAEVDSEVETESLSLHPPHPTIHIVMGRTYAKRLIAEGYLPSPMHWLDNEFAVDETHRVIVCPYFDYRQLSNVKICRLADIMHSLATPDALPTKK
ncbi:hypothetical protein MD588_06750 [Photobacterium sp. SDRW27]|uniref:DUF6942 family protein n=1 Tax=Photobacterium obscurum TaxID=2829490 RepID=UPI002243E8B3|nr:hypothetical protein [Photobacterium obscurum]MCW8328502.1 hypothetical protein [Photobacterium obscurum]